MKNTTFLVDSKKFLLELAKDLYHIRMEDLETDELPDFFYGYGQLIQSISDIQTTNELFQTMMKEGSMLESLGYFPEDDSLDRFIEDVYTYRTT